MQEFKDKCWDSFVFNYAFLRVANLIKEQGFVLVMDKNYTIEELHVYFMEFIEKKLDLIFAHMFTQTKGKVNNSALKDQMAIYLNHYGFFSVKDIQQFLDSRLDERSAVLTQEFLEEKKQKFKSETEEVLLKVLNYLGVVSSMGKIISSLIDSTILKAKTAVVRETWMTEYDVERMQGINTKILAAEKDLGEIKTELGNIVSSCAKLTESIEKHLEFLPEKTTYDQIKVESLLNELKGVKEKTDAVIEKFQQKKKGAESLSIYFFSLQKETSVVESYVKFINSKEQILIELKELEDNLILAEGEFQKYDKNIIVYKKTVNFFKNQVLREYNRSLKLLLYDLSSTMKMFESLV